MRKHTKITKSERVLLNQWKKEGLSNNECARRLGRHPSTIGRELTKNGTKVILGKEKQIIYEPYHAQFVAEERKQRAFTAKQPLKNKKIYAYVLEHLRMGWSPEQIAGRLKVVEHPDDSTWHICHETIYQFIYKQKTDMTASGLQTQAVLQQKLKGLAQPGRFVTVTDHENPLYEYLRRKQKRRRKKGGRKAQRIRIPD